MRRREFIAGLASAAVWPAVAQAQQPSPVHRIGVVMGFGENDPQINGLLSGFTLGLADAGWTDGRNLRMNVRWAAGDVDRMRMFARELVDQEPDAILAVTTPVATALHRETRTSSARSRIDCGTVRPSALAVSPPRAAMGHGQPCRPNRPATA
jgi:putative tryptophan/tyrosine transport system substrate-binding protein